MKTARFSFTQTLNIGKRPFAEISQRSRLFRENRPALAYGDAAISENRQGVEMIYFIRFGTQRLVKIGHSKDHPRIRMGMLQTGTPERLHLLGMVPGGLDEEAEWHKRFAHLRVRGEWFKWTTELREAAKPHLHDPFGEKARKLALEHGLTPYPKWGTRAARNRMNAMQ